MSCVGEGTFPEGEHLGWYDGEQQCRAVAAFVMEHAAACFEMPSSVPLGPPCGGQCRQYAVIGDLNGITLDDDVEALIPLVATGHEHDVAIGPQVDSLLLVRTGAEVK